MNARSERLAPDVFRLPVERIRDGYYSDAYFNHTKELLEHEGRDPRVLMQVFQRKESILGGIDEAIAVLKQCAGRRRADGALGGRAGTTLEVRALHEGDAISPWETVMTIEGDYSLLRPPRDGLPRLPRAAHAGHAQRRARSSRRRAASRSCSSPPATTTGSCRPATAGRRTSPARSASRPTRRRRGGAAAASAPSRTA